jgi:hypothetical protein
MLAPVSRRQAALTDFAVGCRYRRSGVAFLAVDLRQSLGRIAPASLVRALCIGTESTACRFAEMPLTMDAPADRCDIARASDVSRRAGRDSDRDAPLTPGSDNDP